MTFCNFLIRIWQINLDPTYYFGSSSVSLLFMTLSEYDTELCNIYLFGRIRIQLFFYSEQLLIIGFTKVLFKIVSSEHCRQLTTSFLR